MAGQCWDPPRPSPGVSLPGTVARWGAACGKLRLTRAGTTDEAEFARRNRTQDTVYIAEHQYATLLFGFFPICHIPANVYTMRKTNQQWKQLTKSADNSVPS